MKKIILIFFICLISTFSYAASEKVYLKCKKIVTENRSTGKFEDWMAKGKFGQIILTEIIIGNKSSKITISEPFPDFNFREESVGKKVTQVVTKRKAQVDGNSYTGEDMLDDKTKDGSTLSAINRYTFNKNGNTWSVKTRNLFRAKGPKDDINMNYTAEGNCEVIDKKNYKNIIKNGPTRDDLEL